MKITLGDDPEFHIKSNETGKVVSSIPIIKRDKNNPITFKGGVKFYSDNVLAEIAHPPVESSEDGVNLFRQIFGTIQDFLGLKYSLLPQASAYYDKDQLTDPKAIEVGCNPNYNAYVEAENPKVQFGKSGLRTGSFHIHLGHPELKSLYDKGDFVKLMDIYLGCASVIFDKDPTGPERRRFYGRAGEFRWTDYGIEYRVLGNYALRCPSLTKLVFDIATYAASHVTNKTVKDVIGIKGIQLKSQLAINTNNATAAKWVLVKAGMPTLLMSRVEADVKVGELNKEWAVA